MGLALEVELDFEVELDLDSMFHVGCPAVHIEYPSAYRSSQ